MPNPTSIRLSAEAEAALEKLRGKLGSKWAKPSVSKVISMVLTKKINLDDYEIQNGVKEELMEKLKT